MQAVYPGSFNPPTIAHLALADATLDLGFERVTLVVSRQALGKGAVERPTIDERLAVLRSSVADRPGVEVELTEARLLADIAAGADGLVVGMDKWRQIHEVAWYDDVASRDAAIRSLPTVLLVGRDGEPEPEPVPDGPEVVHLPVEARLVDAVSSTAARAGRLDLMTPAARSFAETHGVWGAGLGS